MFAAFTASCPPPWPAPGLALTPEIHCQSELWLPLAHIRPAFERLCRSTLNYAPILSSTPFHQALSWADVFNELGPRFQSTANPARLLEMLLGDHELLKEFLFASFLPRRFYGGRVRYPGQEAFIRQWLAERAAAPVRCLDAACGDGAGTYGLARLLVEAGYGTEGFGVEGWTIDPLEVWAAAHGVFPHDPQRQARYREWTAPVFEAGVHSSIMFRTMDLLGDVIVPPFAKGGLGGISPAAELQIPLARFDLILCNGLLGGPIIHRQEELLRVAVNLAELLRPGGLLLAADRFHGGWKQQIPKDSLGDLFKACGLVAGEVGEGIGGLKPC